ncbi:MAG: response regulator transcription factor [Polyangiales bacterium]
MIRVFLADDHAVLRDGLRRILHDAGDIEVVGETGDGREVLRRAGTEPWDVLVLDLSLAGRSGLEVLHELRATQRAVRVLVLTMHAEGPWVERVFQAGALGFLSKGAASEAVVDAIRAVASGARYGQGAATHPSAPADASPHAELSARQLEILVMIGQGKSPKEIAGTLDLRASTVSTHLQRIKTALALSTNSELAQYALRAGLVAWEAEAPRR